MLHARRKRMQSLTEAEALGHTFWTAHFEEAARSRIAATIERLDAGAIAIATAKVQAHLKSELGINPQLKFPSDLIQFIETRCPNELMPSLMEAILLSLAAFGSVGVEPVWNEIMAEHRISFELIAGEMIEFESKEMHSEVVAPTLRLLSGRSGWQDVESAYQDALRELSDGTPSDAITDAARALQEALSLLGCQGNALGPLINDAQKRGILTKYDRKIADWVSADRSIMGDSHHTSAGVTREDAWLAVHIVGAFLLRLTGGPRSSA